MEYPEVTMWVDGSCLGNPGNGGWGAVLEWKGTAKEFSGFIPDTTNNRAELTAMIEGLRCLKRPCKVTVLSDSQVTVKCANGEYGRHSNRDLWEQYAALEEKHIIHAQWVKGHNGTPGNERAHKLADQAARKVYQP